jgi:diguanylate cyclase (GGDEF)-like protein
MAVASAVRRRALVTLVFVGVLPLPIVAYALGMYVLTGALLPAAPPRQLLGSQLLLFLPVLLMACAGGLMILRIVVSLERATGVDEDDEEVVNPGAVLRQPPDQGGLVVNSISRMLATIERQASELEQRARRLEAADRELESTKIRLQEASFTDDVTGLHDVRFFWLRLEEEVTRCQRFGHQLSVVLLRLDDFTSVCDELTPSAADETLRGVAQILLKASRAIDLVCRHGADEFAILLVETPRRAARVYAERVGGAISAAYWGHGRQVTASFGVSALLEGADTSDDLVRGAEEALHAARQAGKNCVAVWAGPGVGRLAEPPVLAR